MNYRQADIIATTSIATSGTVLEDIDVATPISRLLIILELVNTSYTPANHPLAALKKIEIIDGSDHILAMTGYEAQAMAYYDRGQMDHNELNYENVATIRAAVSLYFGRRLYDPEFALDPTKFRNLQISILHDKALGGCTPTTGNLRVIADLFDEKVISPVGYLMSKEIKSFTPVQGTPEPIQLPGDLPIRKLLVMNTNDNEEPDVQFEKVKIDEDTDARILFEGLTMDLIRSMECRYGRFTEYLSGRAGPGGVDYYLTACKDIQLPTIVCSATAGYNHGAWSGGRKRNIRGSASLDFGCNVSGRCPHGAVPIFFGNQDDPADWWDVTKVGKPRLTVTPRATADAVAGCDTNKTTDIIVQSLRRY